jgi:hypothetical protein
MEIALFLTISTTAYDEQHIIDSLDPMLILCIVCQNAHRPWFGKSS